MPRDRDRDFGTGAADGGKLCRVVFGSFGIEEWIRRVRSLDHSNRGAILRRAIQKISQRCRASGTRLVLHDHSRIALDMAAELARDRAGSLIVQPTGT